MPHYQTGLEQIKNGLKPKFHTLYLKPLRKIIQLFK
jgi:hypothetical protein